MSTAPNATGSNATGHARDHLLAVAAHLFALKGYTDVNVTAIARAASLTTGALYHHFHSKAELYLAVRLDLEERIVERMKEAAAAHHKLRPSARAALRAGFETCSSLGASRILSGQPPAPAPDTIGDFFAGLCGPRRTARAILLTALFRSSVAMLDHGQALEQTQAALEWLF